MWTKDLDPVAVSPGPECLSPAKLLALYDSELSLAETVVARRHLEGCAYCRAETVLWHEMERLCDVAVGASELPPPDVPGYRCTRLLGRGGFGAVWLAEDEEMNRPRAVKVLHPGALTETDVQNLRDEAAIIDDLGPHPHRVRVYRVLTTPNGPALVMEYVRGCSLSELAAEFGPGAVLAASVPPWERLCRYLAQVADALVDVHARGIRHGDITPRNVLWNREKDGAVLVDFGLAARSFNKKGGTLGFASPEAVRGEGVPASDVYGIAATAWRLLTGAPHNPENAFLPAGAPRELEDLLLQSLDPDPNHRPIVARFRDRARFIPTGWLGAKLQAVVSRLTAPVRIDAAGSVLDRRTGATRATEIAIAGNDVAPAEFVPVTLLEAQTGDHLALRVTASRDGFFTLVNLTSSGEMETRSLPEAEPTITLVGQTAEVVGPLDGPPGTEFVAMVWTAASPGATVREWRAKILAAWAELRPANDPDRTFVPTHVATTTSLNDWAAALFVVRHTENT